MHRSTRFFHALITGVALELPFAVWGYNAAMGHSMGSGTLVLAVIHLPSVWLLTVLLRPFASHPGDVTFPMTATFSMQACLYFATIWVLMWFRDHGKRQNAA